MGGEGDSSSDEEHDARAKARKKEKADNKKQYVDVAASLLDQNNPVHCCLFPLNGGMDLKTKKKLLEAIYEEQDSTLLHVLNAKLAMDNAKGGHESMIVQTIKNVGDKLWTEERFLKIYAKKSPQWAQSRQVAARSAKAATARASAAKNVTKR